MQPGTPSSCPSYPPSAHITDRPRSARRPLRPCASANPSPGRGCTRHAAASWPCAARKCAASRGLPSAQRRRYRAPWSSRPPDRSSARHNPAAPARCCRALPAPPHPTSWCRAQAVSSEDCRDRVSPGPPVPSAHRTRRSGDSASRAASRQWATAPRRCSRLPSGVLSFPPSWPPSGLAQATYPCRSERGPTGHARGRWRHSASRTQRSTRWPSSAPCGPLARPASRCGSHLPCDRESRC